MLFSPHDLKSAAFFIRLKVRGKPYPNSLGRAHAQRVFLQVGHGKKSCSSALPNGLVKQTLGQRGGDQIVDAKGAARHTENRDPVGIAAKRSDVSLNPLKSRNLIQQAVIARRVVLGLRRQLWMSQISQGGPNGS